MTPGDVVEIATVRPEGRCSSWPGPMLLAGMVVGLVISIFQAATQINEMTMTFVPKILAVFVVLIITLPWTIAQLTGFTERDVRTHRRRCRGRRDLRRRHPAAGGDRRRLTLRLRRSWPATLPLLDLRNRARALAPRRWPSCSPAALAPAVAPQLPPGAITLSWPALVAEAVQLAADRRAAGLRGEPGLRRPSASPATWPTCRSASRIVNTFDP